ncbi:DUF4089 domain-containing protein [Methyloraptor flagellatus]|jgi:hypothetical protein|uniref:DUF4089 domain-containing protein n=1 Tax=Methyloraptor flagellatus TaxID=3162530 RepID=A0AAU7XEN1_9HYPH
MTKAAAPGFDPAAHVAHMEAQLGLVIDPAWRPTVVANMTAVARAADLVMSWPLPEDIEAAPVFEA